MKKSIKCALIFISGVAVGIGVCGANLFFYAIDDEDIREALKNKISRKINKALYGEKAKRNKTGYVSYKDLYNKRREDIFVNRDGYIVFPSRAEAEEVLDDMRDIINKYGVVTIADLLDMTDISADFFHNKYGWTNLKDVKIRISREGFIIDFPTPFLVN